MSTLSRGSLSRSLAILSRDNVAACDCAVARCDFDDILASRLVRCLAKRQGTNNRSVQKRLAMKQFHHFGTVFVKADRET